MTDTNDVDSPETHGQATEDSRSGAQQDDRTGGLLGPEVERTLKSGAVVVLGLLASWATIQVYASTSRAISIWLSDDFVPVFHAAFNVVVVLLALAGIVWLVRELA